jgi:integrase
MIVFAHPQDLQVIEIDAMGRPRKSIPSLLLHKPSGRSFVEWAGIQYYLGPAGATETAAAYTSICSNITNFGVPIYRPRQDWSVSELVKEYSCHLQKNHPAESKEPAMIDLAMRDLVASFGTLSAGQFTPAQFVRLRQIWIDRRRAVSTCNKWHNYILNLFRWAAMMDHVAPSVWHALLTVPKLKPGRSPAKPVKRVGPVPLEHVEAVRPLVSQQVRDAIDLQLLTGMRSGEVLSMSADQIVNQVYRPLKHKTRWRGHARSVPLGRQAMAIIDRLIAQAAENGRSGLFKLRVDSYGLAIRRACQAANVPHWHPHQLRHAAGTRVRDRHGLDAAQAFLGHASAKTSEIYAKVKNELAERLAGDEG